MKMNGDNITIPTARTKSNLPRFVKLSMIISSILDMPPVYFFYNTFYGLAFYAILFCKANVFPVFRTIFFSYCLYFFFCQFMQMTFFASTSSIFSISIGSIISTCSKPKVFRIYASFIIAMMANTHAFWNFTLMQFVRKTMGRNFLFVIDANLPISTCQNTSIPQPTTSSFFYIYPKSFDRWNCKESACA